MKTERWENKKEYEMDPKENERVIGTVTTTFETRGDYASSTEMYIKLLEKAKKEYPKKVIDIRNVNYYYDSKYYPGTIDSKGKTIESGYYYYDYTCTAKVVEFVSPETKQNETLVKAAEKALSRVNEGARLAIDQISVSGSGLNKDEVKDQLIDILLDKDYRVVAKEYLEKLKTEQEQQAGGGFNEKTTAKTDNFSGVGYFLNVRVNEKSIRIQAINVSTGEYEGNATVEF